MASAPVPPGPQPPQCCADWRSKHASNFDVHQNSHTEPRSGSSAAGQASSCCQNSSKVELQLHRHQELPSSSCCQGSPGGFPQHSQRVGAGRVGSQKQGQRQGQRYGRPGRGCVGDERHTQKSNLATTVNPPPPKGLRCGQCKVVLGSGEPSAATASGWQWLASCPDCCVNLCGGCLLGLALMESKSKHAQFASVGACQNPRCKNPACCCGEACKCTGQPRQGGPKCMTRPLKKTLEELVLNPVSCPACNEAVVFSRASDSEYHENRPKATPVAQVRSACCGSAAPGGGKSSERVADDSINSRENTEQKRGQRSARTEGVSRRTDQQLRETTKLITELGKKQQWQQALKVLESLQLSGTRPSSITYGATINACQKSGQWSQCLKILDQMKREGEPLDVITYSTVISACAKSGEWQRALSLVSEMRAQGIRPNVVTYNAAMCSCQSSGRWAEALHLLRDMRQDNIAIDKVIYGAALGACQRSGRWQAALSLLDEMAACGATADCVSYNTVLGACARKHKWQQALTVLDQMRAAGVDPDLLSYNAAISACADGSGWRTALSLLEEAKSLQDGRGPTTVTYNLAMAACASAKRWEEAAALPEMMQEEGVPQDIVTHNTLLSALEKGGKWQDAIHLFDTMRSNGVNTDKVTQGTLLNACKKAGRWQVALELLASMKMAATSSREPMPNLVAQCAVLGACSNAGEWQHALSVLEGMEATGVEPDSSAYCETITACIVGGQTDLALELAGKMRSRGMQVPSNLFHARGIVGTCSSKSASAEDTAPSAPNSCQTVAAVNDGLNSKDGRCNMQSIVVKNTFINVGGSDDGVKGSSRRVLSAPGRLRNPIL